jgi:hypothetical protein
MPKKTGHYIGVTGFMSRAEVNEALMTVSKETTYRLMVGVLMSSKTLAGEANKWPGRYPRKEAVADIFVDDPRALNLIHYNTDSPNTLFSEVRQIVDLAGPYLDGFQFNVKWPDPSQIEAIREAYPDMYLLLQIGSHAMEQVTSFGRFPFELFKTTIGWYMPFIDAILIDSSGGKGELLNPTRDAPYLRAACEQFPDLGIGIAGGLGFGSIHILNSLVNEFRNLSIDAEGQLRTPKPEDALHLDAVKAYITMGHMVLEGIYIQN